MNLVAYDNVNKFIPSDNYIQNSYKRLLSSTIEYHDVYCLLKRYNVDKDKYDLYVAVYDNKQQGAKNKFLKKDSSGKVKIYLNDIWNELPNYITKENVNIDVELVESQADGKVYKLIF